MDPNEYIMDKMAGFLQILIMLTGLNVSAQIPEQLQQDFLLEDELNTENRLDHHLIKDFSSIWMTKNNDLVYGIIGEEHQRIRIKFISIIKDPFNNAEYVVYGKSMVKDVVCQFSGIIKIIEIKEVKKLHFGVDDEYQNEGIQAQGVLIAKYAFNEFKNQEFSGKFTGDLMSKWYLSENGELHYDDILSFADGYFNNMFLGYWTNHVTGRSKICNWADYRVPMAKGDFDIGAAEFSVSKKYWDKGWKDISIKHWPSEKAIDHSSESTTKKEWWK